VSQDDRRTVRTFYMMYDVLAPRIVNAHITGDLCNMTLVKFLNVSSSRANDIVHVLVALLSLNTYLQ